MVILKESKCFASILSVLQKYFDQYFGATYFSILLGARSLGCMYWSTGEVSFLQNRDFLIPSVDHLWDLIHPHTVANWRRRLFRLLAEFFLTGRCARLCISVHPKRALAREIQDKYLPELGRLSPRVRHSDNSGLFAFSAWGWRTHGVPAVPLSCHGSALSVPSFFRILAHACPHGLFAPHVQRILWECHTSYDGQTTGFSS